MEYFSFRHYKRGDLEQINGEFIVKDDNYFTVKWFYPRIIKDDITISENDEPFFLQEFEAFMNRIRNDIDCVYRRDNEDIFEYKNNTFRIVPESRQTGLNFDSRLVDFRITGHKEELLDTLKEIYDWLQSIMIESTLLDHNL
jgi:hypothetical protein